MRGDGFDLFVSNTVVASGNASVIVMEAAAVGLEDEA
jgi:hypothetical protein